MLDKAIALLPTLIPVISKGIDLITFAAGNTDLIAQVTRSIKNLIKSFDEGSLTQADIDATQADFDALLIEFNSDMPAKPEG